MTPIKITQVSPSSHLLQEVIRLGDDNVTTLGFLPHAAFNQYAENDGILAAVDEAENLAGYLLYRMPRTANHATIAHFCVNSDYRGQGIAEQLFAELCERTKLLHGIDLHCRRDYEDANRLWRRLGFRPLGEKRGRGKQDTTLTRWWYQHPHITLFDLVPPADQKIKVVIDANIFFDFCNPDHAPVESRSLIADWLSSQVEYVVTPELAIEINRQERPNVRQHHQRKQQIYEKIDAPHAQFLEVESELRRKYPDRVTDNALSDLAHLAWTIVASNVGFLVTRDADDLLSIAFEIYERYQVRIFRPADLILHLDELERVKEYQNMRLAGTNLSIRQVKAQEDTRLADVFQYSDKENRSAFLTCIRDLLSNPTVTPCYMVEDEGVPLILFSYQRPAYELHVPLFRINTKSPQKRLVRYLLLRFVTTSAQEGCLFTCITENILHPIVEEALQEDAFQHTHDRWIKPNLFVASSAANVATDFENSLEMHPEIRPYYTMHLQVLRQPEALSNAKVISEIERVLFPAKIADAEITSVIIPIEETWISMWFDEELAAAKLFGADKQRAFNREGVYYSKANRAGLPIPGRLLWYVTKKNGVQGSSSVRACARLDEIVTGSARDLFQQYKHLGIYEWNDLLRLASKDPEARLTAFRFSDPQLFKHPVTFTELTDIYMNETGKNPPI